MRLTSPDFEIGWKSNCRPRGAPSSTSPKTTCLPSKCGVAFTVMKNCEPLLDVLTFYLLHNACVLGFFLRVSTWVVVLDLINIRIVVLPTVFTLPLWPFPDARTNELSRTHVPKGNRSGGVAQAVFCGREWVGAFRAWALGGWRVSFIWEEGWRRRGNRDNKKQTLVSSRSWWQSPCSQCRTLAQKWKAGATPGRGHSRERAPKGQTVLNQKRVHGPFWRQRLVLVFRTRLPRGILSQHCFEFN